MFSYYVSSMRSTLTACLHLHSHTCRSMRRHRRGTSEFRGPLGEHTEAALHGALSPNPASPLSRGLSGGIVGAAVEVLRLRSFFVRWQRFWPSLRRSHCRPPRPTRRFCRRLLPSNSRRDVGASPLNTHRQHSGVGKKCGPLAAGPDYSSTTPSSRRQS